MFRYILVTGVVFICGIVALTGCKTPTEPEIDTTPTAPAGSTLIFGEGFGNDLSNWEGVYMVSSMEMYSQMRISTEAAHQGTHSLTTDSNMTALYHVENNREETGTVGVEFYMKAKTAGKINFGVEIGQNPGSSGMVSPAFGIFFDPSDSIKCIFYTTWPANDVQKMVAPIQPDHWYKCRVELEFASSTVTYYIDDALVHTQTYPTTGSEDIGLMGIDRVLVYRGKYGYPPSESSEGTKPYFVDDIVFYKK
ncbi:MAG: hypothetical protein JXA71_06465 [Chitinispirillaceae bacterium]|nr:hypothetical protein [Chitinispirillaceae bacterium]